MRIGIVPFLHHDSGGTYQYSLTMLKALYEWKCTGCPDQFILFTHDLGHPVLTELPARRGWKYVPLWGERPPPGRRVRELLGRLAGEGPHRDAWRRLKSGMQRLFRSSSSSEEEPPAEPDTHEEATPAEPPDPDVIRPDPVWDGWFKYWRVEFVLHHGPGANPFEVSLPYVLAIHDLQHRLQPEFPEVSADGEWHQREYFFRNACRHATLLLVDSDVGKEDLLNCYGPFGVEPERVKVLPFLPACYLRADVAEEERRRVRAAYELPERYLFYPAQIWPHKNHARLVRALALLKQQGLEAPLVCCGSAPDAVRQQALAEVKHLVEQLGLERQVRFLGYVPERDMSGLFAAAAALVFPTFFGPTNIPPLEAWSLGCPVITSDIRGVREQMGDAAILVDPRSVEAMAEGIRRLWTDPALRAALVERGRARLASYTPAEYAQRVRAIIEDAKERVRTGNALRAPVQSEPEA